MADFVYANEYCPMRGAALYHIKAKGGSGRCEFCEKQVYEPAKPASETAGVRQDDRRAAKVDHGYMFTMSGRCSGCGLTEDDHPLMLSKPGEGVCPVVHGSIRTQVLIGEAGLERTKCPACMVQVEPKEATGEAEGSKYGRGRGVVTKRMEKRLGYIAYLYSKGLPFRAEQV